MTAEGTSAQLCDERARELSRGPLGGGPVREQAEAGGTGPAHGGAEGAGGHQGVEPLLEVGAQRERGGFEVVVERGAELVRRGGSQPLERTGVQRLATRVKTIQLGIDGGRGEPVGDRG